jgi:hypothetical protein
VNCPDDLFSPQVAAVDALAVDPNLEAIASQPGDYVVDNFRIVS